MGTNSLPYLMKWIRYDTPVWKRKLYGMINPALRRLKPSWQLADGEAQIRAEGSLFALITLCPREANVVAELARLADDPATSPVVRARAANVLACIDLRYWKDPSIERFRLLR